MAGMTEMVAEFRERQETRYRRRASKYKAAFKEIRLVQVRGCIRPLNVIDARAAEEFDTRPTFKAVRQSYDKPGPVALHQQRSDAALRPVGYSR